MNQPDLTGECKLLIVIAGLQIERECVDSSLPGHLEAGQCDPFCRFAIAKSKIKILDAEFIYSYVLKFECPVLSAELFSALKSQLPRPQRAR